MWFVVRQTSGGKNEKRSNKMEYGGDLGFCFDTKRNVFLYIDKARLLCPASGLHLPKLVCIHHMKEVCFIRAGNKKQQ